ncbi:hypothetical protein PPM_3229 [Paenibacillus polymyxa M1]|nr:hypothetical protein PPM_3229 [Paenibacillus polymyxa M1]
MASIFLSLKEYYTNPANAYSEVNIMNHTYKVLKSDIELFTVALSH